MKRSSVYFHVLVGTASLWGMTMLLLQLLGRLTDLQAWYLHVLPFYSLITLGCYCLGRIGLDLLLFNDYPSEITALEEDIKTARLDLKRRGFY